MKKTVLVAICALLLGSCDRVQPERVCAQEQTLEAVRHVIANMVVGNSEEPAVQQIRRTLTQSMVIELIRFERRDAASGAIHCRAQVKTSRDGTIADITYARQRQVGSSDHIYSVVLESGARNPHIFMSGLGLLAFHERERQSRAALDVERSQDGRDGSGSARDDTLSANDGAPPSQESITEEERLDQWAGVQPDAPVPLDGSDQAAVEREIAEWSGHAEICANETRSDSERNCTYAGVVANRLSAAGLCHGRHTENPENWLWHRCGANSVRP